MTDKITQADRHRAEQFNCDLRCGMTGTQVHNLAGAFAAHRLAHTQQSDTPVAWMDLLANAYTAGAEDVHNAWVDGTSSSEPDFGEAASDYARSIDFPPATDVAALVEAAKAMVNALDSCIDLTPSVIHRLSAALAPFTKGQP